MGAMRDGDRLLRLIGAVHSGAADENAWTAALDDLSDVMGGGRLLFGEAGHNFSSVAFSGHRVDPRLVDLVNGPLASRQANPLFGAIPQAPHHTPVVLSTKLPRKKFLKSEVFAAVLKPSGVRHVLAVVFNSDSRASHALAIGRGAGAGEFDDDAIRFLAHLSPHFNAALATRQRLAVCLDGLAALDGLDRGVILADAAGQVVFANREAERILLDRDGLESFRGCLSTVHSGTAAQLRQLIAAAVLAAGAQGLEAGGVMRVSRPSLAPDYLVRVTPVGRGERAFNGAVRQPLAAVFIHDPGRKSPVPEIWLAASYGLTNAESMLALCIYEGESLTEAADLLGITINTAKTQLKAVFEKMEVSRQSQLVRRIALGLGGMSGAGPLLTSRHARAG